MLPSEAAVATEVALPAKVAFCDVSKFKTWVLFVKKASGWLLYVPITELLSWVYNNNLASFVVSNNCIVGEALPIFNPVWSESTEPMVTFPVKVAAWEASIVKASLPFVAKTILSLVLANWI